MQSNDDSNEYCQYSLENSELLAEDIVHVSSLFAAVSSVVRHSRYSLFAHRVAVQSVVPHWPRYSLIRYSFSSIFWPLNYRRQLPIQEEQC